MLKWLLKKTEGTRIRKFLYRFYYKNIYDKELIDFVPIHLYDRYICSNYYDLKHGFKNLKTWFFIVWNDRDYDYIYIFKCLKFKLINVRKDVLLSYNADAKQEAEKIQLCINLLNRLIDDDYCSDSYHNMKPIFSFEPAFDKKTGEQINCCTLNIEYPGEDKTKISEKLRKEFSESEKAYEDDLNLLFKTLRENIRTWWT